MNALTKVGPGAVAQYTPDQIELIKRTICKGGTDDELQLFMYQCARTGLDALARQIYAVKRWDGAQKREVMAVQVSIDGFRLIAERSGHYAGQLGPFWCGEDGNWQDVWLAPKPPTAAKVGVLRDDFKEPCWGAARFDAYAGKKQGGDLTLMWATKGDIMIAKCAEALALRKAFPQELSGLYTGDEMEQAAPAQDNAASAPASKPAQATPTATAKDTQGDEDPDGQVKAWVARQKTAMIACATLPALYGWLEQVANSDGTITDPGSGSPLDRLKRKSPEAYGEVTKAFQARIHEINKKANQ